MPTTITMPQLGETVTEGTVAQWLKNVGDSVEKYEAFVEVSTDKVNAEVPSPVSGTLVQIIAKEGETVPTGAPIAIIEEVGGATVAAPSAPAPAAAAASPSAAEAARQGADEPVPGGAPTAAHAARVAGNGAALNAPEVLRRVSPAVRRLAREHHVDLAGVRGSGSGGRITAGDVLAAASQGPAAAVAAAVTAAPEPRGTVAAPVQRPAAAQSVVPGEVMPLTRARKIIAQRMLESKQTAPHAWTMVEVDATNVWNWRSREKDRFARDNGVPLTLLPFFIRAVVEALREYPLMNARFTEEGIMVHKHANIGIAIALDGNLIVPVIRDAQNLTIGGLAVAAGSLIARARAGKLGPDELAGGTFTVNNTGANGSILSAPIINGGQAGIVTMEAVVKRPVVLRGDAIAIRSMMNVCLSLDHRVIDGSVASGFLVDLKRRLEAMDGSGSL
jgi:2-oxoisovalerate dehydrogenase E2 component (dihydrolipoyl transacylase)